MIGIFYGSSSGNIATLAKTIASKLGVAPENVFDVGRSSADMVAGYDTILLGSSTWGFGELQDDWYAFVEKLKLENLAGKRVALFGCGDSDSYPDTFCDAVGILHDELEGSGCEFVGAMAADGYSVTGSRAFAGGKVLGLIADDSDPNKTEGRMTAWIETLKNS